ncbi:MAG: sulfatase [Polyangiales bacterium]|nr:sulfatase-like hydrolase/transferase [Myxococcales bacterium]
MPERDAMRARATLRSGWLVAMLFWAGWFLGEGIYAVLASGDTPWWGVGAAWGAGAPLVLVIALVSSVAWLAWTRIAKVPSWTPSSVRAWLWSDPPEVLARRTGTLLGAGAAIATGVVIASLGMEAVWEKVHTPLLAAMLSALITLVFVAVAILGAAPLVWGLRSLLLLVAKLPYARAVIAPPVVAALPVGAVAVAAALYPENMAALPYAFVVAAAVGTFAALLGILFVAPRAKLAFRTVLVLNALTILLGLFTWFLPPSFAAARRVLFTETSVASLWAGIIESHTDFDEDGATELFGGGDCAPHDPKIHPRALDIPNNGVDEDCRFGDLRADVRAYSTGPSAVPRPAGIADRPNIVLITVDALSHAHTGFGGYGRPVTPNLDAWAKGATVFESAFSASSSTRLSFPALVAGAFVSSVRLLPSRGIPHDFDPSTRTLAVALREHGYETVHVIADDYFDKGRWGGYWMGFDSVDTNAYRAAADPDHTSPEVTDAAIAAVEAPRKAPLFLWVHYYDVHGPYVQPANVRVYGRASVDRYDAELTFLDRQIGRLLAAVRERWPATGRVVAFTADHGEAFDRKHGSMHHDFTLDSAVLHIPLVVEAPWAEGHGARIDGLASQLDVVPTLLNLANVGPWSKAMGESLVPSISKGVAPAKTVLYSLFYIPEDRLKRRDPFRMINVRTDDLAFTIDYEKNTTRLHAWRKDPLEEQELSRANTDDAAIMTYLAARELKWLRSHEQALKKSAKRKSKKSKKKATAATSKAQ